MLYLLEKSKITFLSCLLFTSFALCISPLFSQKEGKNLSQQLLNLDSGNNFLSLEKKVDPSVGEGISYIEVPTGYHFYKSMPPIPFDNDDLKNKRANQPSWFGDMMTAMRYIVQSKTWTNDDDTPLIWDIHAFETIRPSKLLLLNDENTLNFLFTESQSQVQELENKIQLLNHQLNNSPDLSTFQVQFLKNSIATLSNEKKSFEKDLLMFRIATGFKMSCEEQLECLKSLSFNGVFRAAYRKEKAPLIEEGKAPLLNRISYDSEIDTALLRIINRCINVDGYYNPSVPSLWHYKGLFHEEVAFSQTRGVLKRDFSSPYDWTNQEQSEEYQKVLRIAEERFTISNNK